MKLNKIFFVLSVAAAFAACSNDEVLSAQQDASDEIVAPEGGLVPVRLGIGTTDITRAAIESDANKLFELDSIGMFMLARYETGINAEPLPLDWLRTSPVSQTVHTGVSSDYPVWVDNRISRAKKNDGGTAVNVLFRTTDDTNDTLVYYPVGNWYSYRFYGYYPYQDFSNVEYNAYTRKVHFYGLDGKTDILWGRSGRADLSDSKEKFAYCAKYFRFSGNSQKYPEVKFKHRMMAFQFQIQGLPDENAATEADKWTGCDSMSIDTIIIVNAPTEAVLTVADLADDTDDDSDPNCQDGILHSDWVNNLQDLGVVGWPLIDKDVPGYDEHIDGEFSKKRCHRDSIMDVGQRFLLPIIDADAVAAGYNVDAQDTSPKYRVKVRLRQHNGTSSETFDHEKPIDLNILTSGGYKMGDCYKILLQISGPKHINMKATLEPWVDVAPDPSNDQGVKPLEFN